MSLVKVSYNIRKGNIDCERCENEDECFAIEAIRSAKDWSENEPFEVTNNKLRKRAYREVKDTEPAQSECEHDDYFKYQKRMGDYLTLK